MVEMIPAAEARYRSTIYIDLFCSCGAPLAGSIEWGVVRRYLLRVTSI